MVAIPSIQNFERDLGSMISGKLDEALEGIVDKFSKIGDELTGRASGLLDRIKEPFVSIRDAMKINITGRAMDRVRAIAPLPGLRRQDPVESSLVNLSEVTEKGFKDTVDSLNKIEEYFKWQDEKQQAEDDKYQEPNQEQNPEPTQEDKKDFSAMILGGFKNFLGKVFSFLTKGALVIGVGTLIWNGISKMFDDVTKGIDFAEDAGMNREAGAIRGLLLGFQDDLMSRISAMGRWAAIGAMAGIPGGPGGILAGGLLGAALGGAVMIVDQWIGDYINRGLDALYDGADQFMEVFTGGNEERIKGRIADLMKKEDAMGKELEGYYDRIESLEKQIRKAELEGNDAIVNRLKRELTKVKDAQASKLADFDANRERIRGFQDELDVADKGFMDRLSLLWKDNIELPLTNATQYILETMFGKDIGRRMNEWADYIYEGTTGYLKTSWEMATRPFVNGWKSLTGVWDDGMNYLDKEIERTKLYWTGLFDETVNKVVSGVDSIGTFLTETIPDFVGGFFDNLKKKMADAFTYVKELGKVMYEEISVSDFNPFSDGPTYGERISARMAEYESKSRIRDNAESKNASADATFTAIQESADRAFERAVNANVGISNQTKVENNSFYDSGIAVRDKDPASVRDLLTINGITTNP
uniref:Uncharacterized protein n=1 Tax=Ochrobactrum phage ORM_20 TaxID=2985243 RepID=A0A9N6WSH1_9VIRU|nr:hypothetical protein ORM20_00024 [Ochrobactrum phage ORM_20]